MDALEHFQETISGGDEAASRQCYQTYMATARYQTYTATARTAMAADERRAALAGCRWALEHVPQCNATHADAMNGR